AFALTICANITVNQATAAFISGDIEQVKPNDVGLLLGTGKFLSNGNNNPFFFNRIDAAVALFKSGKIKHIIISGDNSREDYNEPADMKAELVRNEIPDSLIYLDYAGFRTLDAVVRARDIFGQSSFVVISQQFHNQRAVYLARAFGINAFGYNAKEVSTGMGFRTKMREFFARSKMFLDLFFGVKPRFLGEKVVIK
ncbi:MAG: ElyC/SanA/YdcF family protein, partial [Bacteroidota bacterium]